MKKLTEYTPEQLIFLGLLASNFAKDMQGKMDIILKFDDSDTKMDLYQFYAKQLAMAQTWDREIMSASVALEIQNKIKEN